MDGEQEWRLWRDLVYDDPDARWVWENVLEELFADEGAGEGEDVIEELGAVGPDPNPMRWAPTRGSA